MEHKTDVMIVGAGPVGLFLACDLVRRGIKVRIVDSERGYSRYSKALAVTARTLEIFNDLGLADKAIQLGRPLKFANFHQESRLLSQIHLGSIPSCKAAIIRQYPSWGNGMAASAP